MTGARDVRSSAIVENFPSTVDACPTSAFVILSEAKDLCISPSQEQCLLVAADYLLANSPRCRASSQACTGSRPVTCLYHAG